MKRLGSSNIIIIIIFCCVVFDKPRYGQTLAHLE